MVNEDDIFLTPAEARKILKLKRSTFYEYVRQGIVPAKRVGGFIRILKSDIINCNFGKPSN